MAKTFVCNMCGSADVHVSKGFEVSRSNIVGRDPDEFYFECGVCNVAGGMVSLKDFLNFCNEKKADPSGEIDKIFN